jgi:hypothetical protein
MMSKWKLVPVEPTQAMIDATNSVPEGAGYLSCVRAYRAMLDAAPAWQAEPVAWVRNLTDAHPHCVTGLQFRSAADVDAGVLYTPLYATPPSAELARLRAENERLRGALDNILARTHDGSSYRMAQDIYQTAIDALVPTAPPAR